ncbi:MAG: rRNA maturation RNase YbeY [Flavobacteriales bacterium]|nr:rRNA maturation RNase YbeY [Flavobacteriales bacterium]MBX2959009.1 rRNA maturation RNase YbeY [Flavobacteriales bacterium]HRN40458.1 rRNA maturation RNase YbeY [Vicingus sp.]HRP58848.1 rRNA maturation RNase YbeY [Vicingus sp.]
MSLSISFHSEDVDFQLENEQQIIDWIKNTIQQEAKSATEISYIFCTDEYLYQMNLEYLNHDTYTDIITFDYTEKSVVSGDIFISIDRVKENAIKFKTTFKNELSRVIIHGVLHLLGYKDKTPEQKQVMRSKEDFYLTLQGEIG